MKDYWSDFIKDLKSFRDCQNIGSMRADVTELSCNMKRLVKDQFPMNQVPQRIVNTLEDLSNRMKIAEEQFELTIDIIINEIEIKSEKGEL